MSKSKLFSIHAYVCICAQKCTTCVCTCVSVNAIMFRARTIRLSEFDYSRIWRDFVLPTEQGWYIYHECSSKRAIMPRVFVHQVSTRKLRFLSALKIRFPWIRFHTCLFLYLTNRYACKINLVWYKFSKKIFKNRNLILILYTCPLILFKVFTFFIYKIIIINNH